MAASVSHQPQSSVRIEIQGILNSVIVNLNSPVSKLRDIYTNLGDYDFYFNGLIVDEGKSFRNNNIPADGLIRCRFKTRRSGSGKDVPASTSSSSNIAAFTGDSFKKLVADVEEWITNNPTCKIVSISNTYDHYKIKHHSMIVYESL